MDQGIPKRGGCTPLIGFDVMDVDGECRRRDLVGGGGGACPPGNFFSDFTLYNLQHSRDSKSVGEGMK